MKPLKRYLRQPLGVIGAALAVALILMAALGPWLAPYDTGTADYSQQWRPPGRAHWLGTELYGVDVLSRIIAGARMTLAIGLGASLLTVVIGMAFGVLAGYAGGRTDLLVSRLVDVTLAFPGLLLVMVLAAALGRAAGTMTAVLLSLALVNWAPVAQLVRGQVLALKGREFVTASRALGASHARLLLRHILPNCLSVLLVVFTMRLGTTILAEASLGFLGLGVSDQNSWGYLVKQYYEDPMHWWSSVFPATAIALTVIAFNLVGDALRDALDPKLR